MADLLLIVALVLVLLIGVLVFALIIIYNIFRPFREYFMCQLPNSKKRDCIMIVGQDGKISLKSANLGDSEFMTKPEPPYSYLGDDIKPFNLGSVRIAAIIDNWNITRDRQLCKTVIGLKNDYGIDNYEEFRSWYDQEQDGSLIYQDGQKVPPQNYILYNKPVAKNAFKEIPFARLHEYISSVFPDEVNSYIDSETAKFIDLNVLQKNDGSKSKMMIIILVVVIGFVAMAALGTKAMGMW